MYYKTFTDPTTKKEPVVLLVLYTNDFSYDGQKVVTNKAFLEGHRTFGFSEDTIKDPEMKAIIGLSIIRQPTGNDGIRVAFIHQAEYAITICTKYGIAGPHLLVNPVSTPCKVRDDHSNELRRTKPGRFSTSSSTHVGRLP